MCRVQEQNVRHDYGECAVIVRIDVNLLVVAFVSFCWAQGGAGGAGDGGASKGGAVVFGRLLTSLLSSPGVLVPVAERKP